MSSAHAPGREGARTDGGLNVGDTPTGRKYVVDKSPPDALRAVYGAECVVPPVRFDSIDPGDEVSCVWADELEPDLAGGMQ